MSEYWVSHKRYLCKYCNIYIADDKPSRQQHENGLRHKGNVERFVRGLYKEGEKKAKEREEEKGIMASVGRAAEAAYAMDVASGRAGSSGSGGSSSRGTAAAAVAPAPKPKPAKPTDPYANYTTAASLGYRDPEAEEAEQRLHAGTPGAWTVVTATATATRGTDVSGSGERQAEDGTKKRPSAETGDEDGRSFKLRKKTIGVGLGEMYDPGIIKVKGKQKQEEEPQEEPQEEPRMKWAKVEWKGASDTDDGVRPVRPVTDDPGDELTEKEMPLFRKRRRGCR